MEVCVCMGEGRVGVRVCVFVYGEGGVGVCVWVVCVWGRGR